MAKKTLNIAQEGLNYDLSWKVWVLLSMENKFVNWFTGILILAPKNTCWRHSWKGRRYFDKSMSKTTEKMIDDQLRRIFKQDTAIWWELTAISALFLISSANSVLVSVTLFGAAILSCIFRLFGFPDVWPQGPMGKQPCSPSDSPRIELSKVHLLGF